MIDSVEHRRQRLAEAIAWCALQKLQNNPPESEDVKCRRALGERATNHAFAAHQLEAASPFKWVTRGKVKKMKEEASQMLAEARLDEIRPLADQLRTPELKSDRQLSDLKMRDEDRVAIVEDLCERRVRLLKESQSYPDLAAVALLGGRVLRCAPKENCGDRSLGYESKGFFDANSCPPWDTWVCFAGGELLACVPRLLCGLAQRGIEVDTGECIRWAGQALLANLFAI